jgi:RimJ/RimL family protein N-acetyltransferase
MNIFKEILDENLEIETQRLIIHKFELNAKVIIDLFEIYSNESNVIGYSKQFKDIEEFAIYTKEKIRIHQEEINGIISYLIKHKKDNKYIGVRNIILDGTYTYDNNRKDNNNNIISEIIINKNYWNNSYAEESSLAIFNILKIHKIKHIVTFVNNFNLPAIKLNKKLDFHSIDRYMLIENLNYNEDSLMHTSDIHNSHIFAKKLND